MPDRLLFDVPLRPVIGSRFAPAGFPDLGVAEFDRFLDNGASERCVLVESAQSMANHLEAVAWSRGSEAPTPPFGALPWVSVVADEDGRFLTSSRTEAHRLASAFIKDSTLDGRDMRSVIRDRLDLREDTPLSPRRIARAIFALDPMCLVHGVFFAEGAKVWPGQPKIARALTAMVEAHGVKEAMSGGVKRDAVRHSVSEGGGTSEGYGSVPFHRVEYTAREVVASFCLDLDQLRAYGLDKPSTDLLASAALLKVRRLLDGGFRPRTNCDLEPTTDAVIDRTGVRLESTAALEERLSDLAAASDGAFGERPLIVRWSARKAKA